MKDNQSFTANAIDRAARMAKRSKTVPLPEGKSFEQVADDISKNSMAWLQVFQALHFLESNPLVIPSPTALDFVRIVRELARSGQMTDSAEEALDPLDGALPKSKPFIDRHGRGAGPVKKLVEKVLPGLEKRLKRKASALEVWRACAARRASGVKFETTKVWGMPLRATPRDGKAASWPRFRVIVSEVRASTET